MGATGPTDVPDSPAAVRRDPGPAAGVRGLTRCVEPAVRRDATRVECTYDDDAVTPGGPRAAGRHRGGPGPRGAAGHPGAGGAGVPRDLRRALAGARGRPDDHLRPRPRRDGAGQGHRGALDLRAPPGAVLRGRARRLHPVARRPHHRPVEAGPAGRRLRPPPAGAGAADHADRRLADAHPGAARRDRGHRVRAPVHVDARHPQARRDDGDVGGARPAARPRDPGRGHEPHRRAGELRPCVPRPRRAVHRAACRAAARPAAPW